MGGGVLKTGKTPNTPVNCDSLFKGNKSNSLPTLNIPTTESLDSAFSEMGKMVGDIYISSASNVKSMRYSFQNSQLSRIFSDIDWGRVIYLTAAFDNCARFNPVPIIIACNGLFSECIDAAGMFRKTDVSQDHIPDGTIIKFPKATRINQLFEECMFLASGSATKLSIECGIQSCNCSGILASSLPVNDLADIWICYKNQETGVVGDITGSMDQAFYNRSNLASPPIGIFRTYEYASEPGTFVKDWNIWASSTDSTFYGCTKLSLSNLTDAGGVIRIHNVLFNNSTNCNYTFKDCPLLSKSTGSIAFWTSLYKATQAQSYVTNLTTPMPDKFIEIAISIQNPLDDLPSTAVPIINLATSPFGSPESYKRRLILYIVKPLQTLPLIRSTAGFSQISYVGDINNSRIIPFSPAYDRAISTAEQYSSTWCIESVYLHYIEITPGELQTLLSRRGVQSPFGHHYTVFTSPCKLRLDGTSLSAISGRTVTVDCVGLDDAGKTYLRAHPVTGISFVNL